MTHGDESQPILIDARAAKSVISTGVSAGIITVCVFLFVGKIILSLLGNAFNPYDDTDSFNGTRSRLKAYTDCGTGVQYVAVEHGGLAVRVDKDGKPIVRSC